MDSRIVAWSWLIGHMQVRESLVIEPVEVGPPFPGGEHLAILTTPLPLIEPSSPEKLKAMSCLASLQRGNG